MNRSCLYCASLLGTALLASAAGGEVTHRVTDLGSLSSTDGQSEAFAINDNRRVTGWSSVVAPGVFYRVFVWLPEPGLGFDAAGMHDLDPGSGLNSFGHDINLEGRITGTRETGSPVSQRHAFLWEPGQAIQDLGSLAGADGKSDGWSISDGDPFLVVGESETADTCDGYNPIFLGFTWPSDSQVMDDLAAAGSTPGGADNDASAAFVISADATTIGGYAYVCPATEAWCEGPSSDAVSWLPASALLQPAGFENGEGAAFGANNLDPAVVVGYGLKRYPEQAPLCRDRALLWTLDDPVTVVDLHSNVQNPPPAPEQTWAKAVNDNMNAVGANGDGLLPVDAVLWEFDGETWTYVSLEDRTDSLCGWNLKEARDISNAEWIVGWGEHEGVQRAFLLTPLGDCPADINGDRQVDVQDFLLFLAWWGECPTGVICAGDITADCTVDVQDFLAYLAAFGPCPESRGQGLPSGGGSSGLSFPEAAQVLGFASLEAYVAWATEASEAEVLASIEMLSALLQ